MVQNVSFLLLLLNSQIIVVISCRDSRYEKPRMLKSIAAQKTPRGWNQKVEPGKGETRGWSQLCGEDQEQGIWRIETQTGEAVSLSNWEHSTDSWQSN